MFSIFLGKLRSRILGQRYKWFIKKILINPKFSHFTKILSSIQQVEIKIKGDMSAIPSGLLDVCQTAVLALRFMPFLPDMAVPIISSSGAWWQAMYQSVEQNKGWNGLTVLKELSLITLNWAMFLNFTRG